MAQEPQLPPGVEQHLHRDQIGAVSDRRADDRPRDQSQIFHENASCFRGPRDPGAVRFARDTAHYTTFPPKREQPQVFTFSMGPRQQVPL